ncbi:Shr3 amino acid permease chaperone [Lipomyces japonicus]|uniref:Shr3 amino acid permease chaperone n=1 Tax=Lipomyces japonicus TaxID=56871 RepID=UPI0034CED773
MPTSATSFSTSLILCSTSFLLGILFVNWTYDHKTLWTKDPVESSFENSRQHYALLATAPVIMLRVFHIVIGFALLGFVLKLYKPSESNKLFDGGSLVLFMAGLVTYLTNIRNGLVSILDGDWGEVDEKTGINVLAASEVIIAIALIGVLTLQVGQYYAERQDDLERENFDREEREVRQRAKQQPTTTATAARGEHESNKHGERKKTK